MSISTDTQQLFCSQQEIDFVAGINYELIERVIGQRVILYAIDAERTHVHPLYGESQEKIYKTPIEVPCLVYYEEPEAKTNSYNTDVTYAIKVYFHKRSLKERVLATPREGDILKWGTVFYEIVKATEPQLLFGRVQNSIMIEALCKVARLDETGLTAPEVFAEQFA